MFVPLNGTPSHMKYCINSILGEAFFLHVFIFFHLQDSGRSVLTSNLILIFDGMKVKTENSIINLLYGYQVTRTLPKCYM